MSIAIIIPFFQKEVGILNKCLASVFKQEGGLDYKVIIVDDDSPVSPELEMANLSLKEINRIKVIRRKNGGPGQARNTALDYAHKEGFDYIAFLDSDDIWAPSHLNSAILALSKGYDFYFSNFFQQGSSISVFEKAENNGSFDFKDHRLLLEKGCFEYVGDFSAQIICANLIGTSTVVFRAENTGQVRFNPGFYFAGEDYLFWLEVTQKLSGVVFGAKCTCHCGKGVNIYGANGWGGRYALERIRDEWKYLKLTQKLYPLTGKAQDVRKSKIKRLKKSAMMELKHRVLRVKKIRFSTLLQISQLLLWPKA